MPWVSPEFSYPEVPSFMEPVGAGNAQKFDHRRTNENASRLAFCMGSFVTTGWGEFIMPEAFVFDCLFVGQPFVFTGWAFGDVDYIPDPFAPPVAPSMVPTRFPRVSSGVAEFHYDVRKLYSSAHMVFTVETRSPELITDQAVDIPNYVITHYFMFTGIGMKQLPQVKQ